MAERDEKILDALASALSLIHEAMKAKTAGKDYRLLLWRSSAEAEYAAFQISMTKGLSDYETSTSTSTDDADDSLGLARGLLNDAHSSIHAEPRRAYQAVREAIGHMRGTLASLEKLAKSGNPPSVSAPKNE